MVTWLRPGTIIRVHDGDTAIADIDLGHHARKGRVEFDLGWHVRIRTDGHIVIRNAIRVDGLAAPELGTPAGEASRLYAEDLLPPGTLVQIASKRLLGSFEKYGRILADLELPSGQSFADAMIAAGHGVAWDGTGRQPG